MEMNGMAGRTPKDWFQAITFIQLKLQSHETSALIPYIAKEKFVH